MSAPDIDPFSGGESIPSLSFKDEPVGTVKTITVTEPAKLLQSRDYNTDEPAYWPAKAGQTPNPKMAAVINGTDDEGVERSVWAIKPSALFKAIKDAQTTIGRALKAGDKLAIKLTGTDPSSDPKKADKKLYAAKITPGVEPPPADAFGDEPPF